MGSEGEKYASNGAKTSSEKAIDDWLPITSSRNAKWWYSAFHNVTAIVSAGVLSLAFAMSELGWGPGIAVLVISWIVTLYTLWQMVLGKRFDRYHELGQHAFGEKLGVWIVVPQQLVVEVGVNIVYMVTGGNSLKKFHDTVCSSCKPIKKQTYFIMIFGSVHFVLSQLPNFNSISGVSLAAAVKSLSYSVIAWGALQYGYKAHSTARTVFDFFSALGYVAFAYAGHNVVLEIQATIPSTPEKPSKGPMWKGVIVAYIVVALCYFPVALVGYWAFGNSVQDNILISLSKPAWLIAMANMMVVIHVIGSNKIYAMPVFDKFKTVLIKKLHFTASFTFRLISSNAYVVFTTFIGMIFTFGGLLEFFGGFAFAPTTYFVLWWCTSYQDVTTTVRVLRLLFAMFHLIEKSNDAEKPSGFNGRSYERVVYRGLQRGIITVLHKHCNADVENGENRDRQCDDADTNYNPTPPDAIRNGPVVQNVDASHQENTQRGPTSQGDPPHKAAKKNEEVYKRIADTCPIVTIFLLSAALLITHNLKKNGFRHGVIIIACMVITVLFVAAAVLLLFWMFYEPGPGVAAVQRWMMLVGFGGVILFLLAGVVDALRSLR